MSIVAILVAVLGFSRETHAGRLCPQRLRWKQVERVSVTRSMGRLTDYDVPLASGLESDLLISTTEALCPDERGVASGPEAAPIIEKTGARFALAGRSQADWMERLATRTRGNAGDGLAPERILHYFLPRAFAEVGVDEMIDDVLRHGQALAPDLVLFEAFALAGPLVAELLGVPSVAHMFGPLPPHEAVEHANDAVSPIWRLYGRDVPGWAGMYHHLTIQICPPMLERAQVPTGETLHLRPVPL